MSSRRDLLGLLYSIGVSHDTGNVERLHYRTALFMHEYERDDRRLVAVEEEGIRRRHL